MSVSRRGADAPELREIVKEQNQRVYAFCRYMLDETSLLGPVLLKIFNVFGKEYRKLVIRNREQYPMAELKLRLFQVTWEVVREQLDLESDGAPIEGSIQRTHPFQKNLINLETADIEQSLELQKQVADRLTYVEPDFRAPVILKDILRFSDDEITQILGIRWGVYRHRLNRGRLEFRDFLRGQLPTSLHAHS